MPEIERVNRVTVYRNRWMQIYEDSVRRADGSEGIYGIVDKPHFAVIVPLHEDGITLVQQFRYPIGQRVWELPQGSWESAHPTPETLARAELAEETGLQAERMQALGFLHAAYGYSTQGYHIFVATGLQQGASALEPEELGLIARKFSLPQIRQLLLSGAISDATTVATFGLLQLHGIVHWPPDR